MAEPPSLQERSHVWIIRPASTFRGNPGDILSGILDVTGLTVNAVLAVDLKPVFYTILIHHTLINPGRAVPLRWLIISRKVLLKRNGCVFKLQVTGLILLVIGIREEH